MDDPLYNDRVSWLLEYLLVAEFSIEDVHFQQVVGDVFVIDKLPLGSQFLAQPSQYTPLKTFTPNILLLVLLGRIAVIRT